MSWTERWDAPPAVRTRTELRKFGLVMTIAFSAIGGIALWRDHAWGIYPVWIGGAFLLPTLVAPGILGPIERGWLAVGERIGRVVTTLILLLAYYLVVTPFGLMKRVTTGDTLGLRPDPGSDSYWAGLDPNRTSARSDRPF